MFQEAKTHKYVERKLPRNLIPIGLEGRVGVQTPLTYLK